MLKCTDATRIDVARVKRMRAVLAAESPAWISTFIGPECAGYDAMLARLDELLAMEWREEQHDDMLLHELLRCFVVLSTTEIGRNALASQAPRPFRQLIELLFSEKKPGDLSTRKLMIEMLAILLDLQLPASQSHSHSSLNYLLTLLQNPCDPAKEAVVDFIKQTHAPRPFKTYVTEIAGVCRDYFWIFCHSQNLYWRFDELHDKIDSITSPKVPGGMTGGVEFEAMAYLTVHLRLINAVANVLAQFKEHQLPKPAMSAIEFHRHLFASGIERVLVTLRKASQHYYPTTHLELARFLCLANEAGYALPYHLTDWLESPKCKAAPLLPPLALGYLQAPAQLPPSAGGAVAPIPVGGAKEGYGMAGAWITPTAPARASSFDTNAGATPAPGASTISRSNAIRTQTVSPTKKGRTPTTSPSKPTIAPQAEPDEWDFSTTNPTVPPPPAQQQHQVQMVPFDRRLDSQFFSSPSPPTDLTVGMPSSSTSKRILGLHQAISQDLTPTATQPALAPTTPNPAPRSMVGSAVKKWESMSISHTPTQLHYPHSRTESKPPHLR